MKYEGIMTALVTPMDENGLVDKETFVNLIQDQLKNDIHSLLVLGGTGEYTALSMDQRKIAIDVAINEVNGKVPVVVGLLSPGVGDNIELGKYAKQAGADSVMVVTPFYVNPTKEGLVEYYESVNQALDMPIILYNIPYKTGIHMTNDVVEKIVKRVPNIVAMKVCSDNMGDIIELIQSVGDKISVLCGEDFRAVSSFITGAPGAITASSNLIPDVWVKIYDLVKKKEYDQAVALHKEFFPLMKALYVEGNPGPLKAALNMIGIPVGSVSVPLLDASTVVKEELKEKLDQLIVPVR
ncbi:4-hydroxy-tetrahydrodipicolinate synthase [Cytobacillus purgationiresistens]|uniref:4-hydroxy-tetrahydrodipicolinate synthase n=1 Tax=Cytobacillus purgationiresistens TaxID=863449 RepID=A0ABU0AN39_9BACI|nr:4-hydroxy-tetrahydrodipicolinate synthase [Cytobacillus purgationiresistens]MDQ0272697.1 4-hydroxy-tetrahydrodipicolinate synthase [Cytobacillus purgationiresistens]